MKRLMLLGAGHAHLHVLQHMAREPLPGVRAVLVTPHPDAVYSGMLPGLAAGHYGPSAGRIPLAALAQAARVELALGSAVALHTGERRVTLADGRSAQYDVLSLDTGGHVDRDAIPGAREHALFLRPLEHFVRLYDQLLALVERRTLDVVVVGGGAAGFEMALALQHRLRLGGVERGRVALVVGHAPLLAGYPPRLQALALAELKRARIPLFAETCAEVTRTHVVLAGGARLACDVPVMALPTQPPPWLADSGLGLCDQGFVATGPTLQSLSHPEVLAAGDVASRPDAPHPRSGVHAVRAGPPLAHNLRRLLAGGALTTHRPPARSLNLLSCGRRSALLAWGPWVTSGPWVWWWKDRIDRRFVASFAVAAGASAVAQRSTQFPDTVEESRAPATTQQPADDVPAPDRAGG